MWYAALVTLSVYAAITLLSVVVNSVLYLVRRVRFVKEKTDWCVCLEEVSSFVVLEELQEEGVSSFVVLEELGEGRSLLVRCVGGIGGRKELKGPPTKSIHRVAFANFHIQ